MHDNDTELGFFDIIITIFAVFSLIFEFIVYDMITANNWYIVIICLVCISIFYAFCFKAWYRGVINSNQVVSKKYKLYLFCETRKNKLVDFQKYCWRIRRNKIIQVLASINSDCVNKYDLDLCTLKYDNGDINYFLDIIKNYDKETRRKCKKQIKRAFSSYELPCFFDIFKGYYSKELIKQDKSIWDIFLSVISFIASFLSLFTLNSFMLIPITFWVVLSIPLIVLVIQFIFTFKREVLKIANIYENTLDEMEIEYIKFKKEDQIQGTD